MKPDKKNNPFGIFVLIFSTLSLIILFFLFYISTFSADAINSKNGVPETGWSVLVTMVIFVPMFVVSVALALMFLSLYLVRKRHNEKIGVESRPIVSLRPKDKYILASLILMLGIVLLTYGIKSAEISNLDQIYSENNCDSYLKINEFTQNNPNIYNPCYSPELSSIAKKDYANKYVYSGVVIILSGASLITIRIINSRKSN